MFGTVAGLARDQRAELLGLLTNLSADDWAHPTPCRGWNLKELISHVVEGELLFGRVYRGELKELTRADTDPYAGVERWRLADGETVRYSLWHHGSATQRVIDSRSEESWRRPVILFGSAADLGDVLRLHTFDLGVHSHDVATTVKTEPPWEGLLPFLIDYCVRGVPRALTSVARAVEGPLSVRVPGIGEWTFERLDGGGWGVVDRHETGTTVDADPETLILLTTGRLETHAALDRSTVSGDAGLVEALLDAWRVKG